MPEFVNNNRHSVSLLGPDKTVKVIAPNERVILSDYFKRYIPRYLKILNENVTTKPIIVSTNKSTISIEFPMRHPRRVEPNKTRIPVREIRAKYTSGQRQIVGRVSMASIEATKYYQKMIASNTLFPISNDIGIGILSYNRLNSLKRLIDSIIKHTNLVMTTVFISDESTDQSIKQYLTTLGNNFVIVPTTERLGVAGNTNRLLQCLSRFTYKIILNDDVEILQPGWEHFFVDVLQKTGFHHFCYRQEGLLGASRAEGQITNQCGMRVQTIKEKPHGAVLVLDDIAFKTVGYFDESFGIYGMEHVDWSWRINKSGIQPEGYHDVIGAEHFYTIHHDSSVVENRASHLQIARNLMQAKHQDKTRCYINHNEKSKVAGVSYIIPYRSTDNRNNTIKTVALNIKAQKFPFIEIIMVEQDKATNIAYPVFKSIKYALAKSPTDSSPFIKALAFNTGFGCATQNKIILHDADMLVQNDYTTIVDNLLKEHEGVHIGKNVLYLTRDATSKLTTNDVLAPDLQLERTVGYFEGGSIACAYNTYIEIGGFNEDFIGYGVEDCEFFQRLTSRLFFNQRSLDFVHLWHDRIQGWQVHHQRNKTIHAGLLTKPMSWRCLDLKNRLMAKYGYKIKT